MKKTPLTIFTMLLAAGLLGLPRTVHSNTPSQNIIVTTNLDLPTVLAGTDQDIVLKVNLSAPEIKIKKERLPMNVAIVLDKSGSMGSHRKIENAKNGALEIIDRLNNKDVVSLTVYDSSARVIIPAQHLNNKDHFRRALQNINSGGSTALYDGIALGAREIRKFRSPERMNRIILLSDGLANVGPQSTEEIGAFGGTLEAEGVLVSTIGVGLDYNEDLMTSLSEQSGGNAYFARNSDELPSIFAQEVGEAMTLMARNIKVSVQTAPGIIPQRTLGREGDVAWNNMSITIPNLYGLNDKYALFEMRVPPLKHGATSPICRVAVEYTDPITQTTQTIYREITIKSSKKSRDVARHQNSDIIVAAALNRAYETKETAIEFADKGNLKEAIRLLEKQSRELEQTAKVCNNNPKLVHEAKDHKRLAREFTANKRMTRLNRKGMKSSAWIGKTQQYAPQRASQSRLRINSQTAGQTLHMAPQGGVQTSTYIVDPTRTRQHVGYQQSTYDTNTGLINRY